ncbi:MULTISPECIES: hypothetical protein [unclassified Exiguobacterium]|uniref:hypothetical protein n=1 Tax=unclassified Exiguobacterium TaxID=2644629 RepID=UPI001357DC58|nr:MULTISPECIES: hypothetical protein [unclassified Exiguobacterium]
MGPGRAVAGIRRYRVRDDHLPPPARARARRGDASTDRPPRLQLEGAAGRGRHTGEAERRACARMVRTHRGDPL